MLGYARAMCGLIGTFLALIFCLKVGDVGNEKNDRGLVRELIDVALWGYIGKKYFDFIGVTRP